MKNILEVSMQCLLTKPNQVLSVSEDIEDLLGFTAEEFTSGKINLKDRIHTHDADLAEQLFSPILSPSSDSLNVRLRQKSGQIRCTKVSFTKHLVTDSDDVILEVLLQDAKSLHKAFDNQPIMSNFNAMMENTDDYIYFKDQNHVFTGASETLVSLTDPSEHWTDLLGLTDYDVFPEEYADIYYKLEKQVLSGIHIAHEEQEILDNKGNKGWVDNRKYPIQDDSGHIIGLFGVARDITDNKNKKITIERLLAEKTAILDNSLVGIAIVQDRAIRWANKALEEALGYDGGELLGMATRTFYTSDFDYQTIGQAYSHIKSAGVVQNELQFVRKDGALIWVDMRGSLLNEEDGSSLWVFVDVTERKQVELELSQSEQKYRALFDSTHDAVMILENEQFVDANKAALLLFGCPDLATFCLLTPSDTSPPKQPCGTPSHILAKQKIEAAVKEGLQRFEWTHCRVDTGKTFIAEVLLSPMLLNGKMHTQATLHDITARKEIEHKMAHMAFYDSLTQLPNRRLLIDRLGHSFSISARNKHRGALLFLDLDNFKALNDTLGHDVGDELLKQVAARLISGVREGDTVSRLGGDEFVIILENLDINKSEAQAQTTVIANKILTVINEPYQLGQHEYVGSTSIGATLFYDHLSSVDDIIKQADTAMYQAKNDGRNSLRFFGTLTS